MYIADASSELKITLLNTCSRRSTVRSYNSIYNARLQSASDRLAMITKRTKDHRAAAEDLFERANREFQASEDAQEYVAAA